MKKESILSPVRVCTASEMRDLDLIAEKEYGLNATLLMENAGRAASQLIIEKYPHAGKTTEILVFAGKGNNAGDAFVAARRLICLERKVRVFHLQSESGYKDSSSLAHRQNKGIGLILCALICAICV